MRKVVIMNLEMIVTNKCNLDCAHCMRGQKCNNSMSDEVIEATLSQVLAIHNLGICGGEPTLAVDVIEKIFNYIMEKGIIVGRVTAVINGTIYSGKFLECLEMIEKYIEKTLPNRLEKSSFLISKDIYHQEELKKLKLDARFLNNLEFYRSSKYYGGFFYLDPRLKLFREGNAENLDENRTVPLRIFPPIITHVGKRVIGKFYLEDIDNGICKIGSMVAVNCDGVITDCNASIEHQKTIYNFGNVLNESIYDVCMKNGQVVKPHQFVRKIVRQEKEYGSYNN